MTTAPASGIQPVAAQMLDQLARVPR